MRIEMFGYTYTLPADQTQIKLSQMKLNKNSNTQCFNFVM